MACWTTQKKEVLCFMSELDSRSTCRALLKTVKRDPSIVAVFSLVLTRIRGFHVVVTRVRSSREVGRTRCEITTLWNSVISSQCHHSQSFLRLNGICSAPGARGDHLERLPRKPGKSDEIISKIGRNPEMTKSSADTKIPPKISSLGSGRLLALDRDGALRGWNTQSLVLSP